MAAINTSAVAPRRNNFRASDPVMPALNTGGPWDIATGHYVRGKHGEYYLNGGLHHLTGVAGPGNTFKTVVMWDMILSIMDRYFGTEAVAYDTEISHRKNRPLQLSWQFPRLAAEGDFVYDAYGNPNGRMIMTNGVEYMGDEWFSGFCDVMDEKHKVSKKEVDRKNPTVLLTTPFMAPDGSFIRHIRPDVYGMDSLSNFLTSNVAKIQDEHDLGDGKRNMEVMRSGMGKTQMLMEMPVKAARGGGYCVFTAHVGKEFQMDPNSKPPKSLAHMKTGFKFKNVPEKFNFLMNNCWYTYHSAPYYKGTSGTDKIPMYPRNAADKLKEDTDLMTVLICNLRGKSGGSGAPFTLVVSQAEGVLRGLTEFDFCKRHMRYGIGGDEKNYFMEMLPEVKLSRSTVRGKIDSDARLRRAIHFTYELCFMQNHWHLMEREEYYTMGPAEIYKRITDLGYDWNEILDTDPCWNYLEHADLCEQKPLSTRDLQNVALGIYHPFWMKDKPTPKGGDKKAA